MDMKINKGIPLATFLLLLLISIISTSHSLSSLDDNSTELPFHYVVSSTVFPLQKEPHGGYTVSLKFGNPEKSFNFNIDTGSDLTWVQCDYKDRQGLTMPVEKLYKPNMYKNCVECGTPLCVAVQKKAKLPCVDPDMNKPRKKLLCVYRTGYVDGLKIKGYLVSDGIIPIKSSDGTLQHPPLAFGCTNNLEVPKPPKPEQIPEGILGLGNGEASILSQLKSKDLIKNVVGHCFSGSKRKGGYLFFGDKFVPKSPSQISWTPIESPPKNNKIIVEGRYFSGPASLSYNGKPPSIKDLQFMFDSGTADSSFNSKDYKVLVNLINSELNSKGRKFTQTKVDHLTCWKGENPIWNVYMVKDKYLKSIILSFPNNAQFQLPVEVYIGISSQGYICLNIDDSGEAGFDVINVIGASSMTNKLMIFDNEEKRIGWVDRANCDNLPPLSQINR